MEEYFDAVADQVFDLFRDFMKKTVSLSAGWELEREKMRERLRAGELEDREVEVTIPGRSVAPVSILGAGNMEQMEMDLQNMFEKLVPKPARSQRMTVREARPILAAQEIEALIDPEKVNQAAVTLTEDSGIVFLDEIDKIAGEDGGSRGGPDVSRQGVQRDLLPIVEGTTVNTKYGPVRTDYILFIAAGAFHMSKPSDLIPELQGRFPLRVELSPLTSEDFVKILTQPRNALIKQYVELLRTEAVELDFQDEAIQRLAEVATEVNSRAENIGARRLHTIMELLLEEVSFNSAELSGQTITITRQYVDERLKGVMEDQDLSRFIL